MMHQVAHAGMHKIVINHLDRTFVTSDASVMITELEVQHPAAKLVVMAAKAQENEIGDGTNLVRPARATGVISAGLGHGRARAARRGLAAWPGRCAPPR